MKPRIKFYSDGEYIKFDVPDICMGWQLFRFLVLTANYETVSLNK